MKKLIMFLLVLALVSTAAFAEITTKPGLVMGGVSGVLELTALEAATEADNTVDGSTVEATTVARPKGVSVKNFSVKPWVLLDWDNARIIAATNYDAFRAHNTTNYSSVYIISSIKNLFGFNVAHTYMWHNLGTNEFDFTGSDEDETIDANGTDATTLIGTPSVHTAGHPGIGAGSAAFGNRYQNPNINRINATYKNDNFNFDVQWDVATLVSGASFQSATLWNPLTDWEQIKLGVDTDNLAGQVIWRKSDELFAWLDARQWGEAWIELRNLMDVYTVRANDAAEMKLRLSDLDTDVTIDRESFGIGKGNRIQGGSAELDYRSVTGLGSSSIAQVTPGTVMNTLHTIKPMDALTVKVALVADGPAATRSFADWLADDALSLGATYAIDGIGTVGAGLLASFDYSTTDATGVTIPSKMAANYAADTPLTATWDAGDEEWDAAGNVSGMGFWVDANLGGLMDNADIFVSFDGQMGSYLDVAGKAEADVPGDAAIASYGVYNLGAEFGMAVTETIGVKAAVAYGLATGLDYEALTGVDPADVAELDEATTVGEWTTDDAVKIIGYGLGATPLTLNLMADIGINYMMSAYLINELTMGYEALGDGAGDDFGTGARTAYGWTSLNAITAGLKIAANQNTTVKVAGTYNLYLGLPSAADLYLDGADDAAKLAVDNAYALDVASNYSPWKIKVSYSYKY